MDTETAGALFGGGERVTVRRLGAEWTGRVVGIIDRPALLMDTEHGDRVAIVLENAFVDRELGRFTLGSPVEPSPGPRDETRSESGGGPCPVCGRRVDCCREIDRLSDWGHRGWNEAMRLQIGLQRLKGENTALSMRLRERGLDGE